MAAPRARLGLADLARLRQAEPTTTATAAPVANIRADEAATLAAKLAAYAADPAVVAALEAAADAHCRAEMTAQYYRRAVGFGGGERQMAHLHQMESAAAVADDAAMSVPDGIDVVGFASARARTGIGAAEWLADKAREATEAARRWQRLHIGATIDRLYGGPVTVVAHASGDINPDYVLVRDRDHEFWVDSKSL